MLLQDCGATVFERLISDDGSARLPLRMSAGYALALPLSRAAGDAEMSKHAAPGPAAVRYYAKHPEICATRVAEGDRLTTRFNDYASRRDMAMQMSNVGSMFHI